MTINVNDYLDVRGRLQELGCNEPTGFALLPLNFDSAENISEFRQTSEAATVKTLLRSANLPHDDIVDKGDRPPYVQNNDFVWVAPTLFISLALISENSASVSIALDLIASYAKDAFKGMSSSKEVKLEIVVETSKKRVCKKISYEGSVEGLQDVASVVEATKGE